jgi:hypothetical protein
MIKQSHEKKIYKNAQFCIYHQSYHQRDKQQMMIINIIKK